MRRGDFNDDLQVLRGVAVLAVMFHHRYDLLHWKKLPLFGYIDPLFDFWAGVDIFFVVSGFIIAKELFREIYSFTDRDVQAAPMLASFWTRRAFRILPMAWLTIFVVLLLTCVFNKFGSWGHFDDNFRDGIASVIGVMNFRLWGQINSGATYFGFGSLGVLWSLSTEEQFYILLPLAILFISRRWLPAFLVCACVAQLVLPRPPGSLLWFMRCDALLLGVLIALSLESVWRPAFEPAFFAKMGHFRAVGAIFLLIIIFAVSKDGVGPFSTGIVTVVAAGLVWIASFNKSYLMAPSSIKNGFIWIGARSYSMYLIHIPIFRAMSELWGRYSGGAMMPRRYHLYYSAAAFVIICAISSLTYLFVEGPFRRLGKYVISRRRNEVAPEPIAA